MWGLALAFVAGCASQPPARPMAANDPTNPNAPEAPVPPPSALLASTSNDEPNVAAPTEPSMTGMRHDMGGMNMREMKHDTSNMDMPGMQGMQHDMSGMHHGATSQPREELNK